MKSLRSRIVALVALVSAAALAACGSFGGPRTVTLDEAQIGLWVARQFPVQRRVLELFDLEIAAPTLRLIPERNRLAGDFSVVGSDRLSRRPVRGRLVLESALRYEPSDASLRLLQVRVQRIELDLASTATPAPQPPSAAAAPNSPASRAATAMAEQVLEDFAIYRIPPQRIESLRALGLSPGAVTVTSRGIEITFEPIHR